MAELVLSSFQQASFRGIPFLYTDFSQTGGRKYKTFEYPNLDNRVTQDLGGYQRIYRMTATIADTTANYKNARQQFIDALEQEGVGVLIHPIEGVKNVFAHPYTLKESISFTGKAVFELTFEETGVQLYPDQSPSNASNIGQQLNSLISQINSNFQEVWSVISYYEGNIIYSANLIQGMVQVFTNAGSIASNQIDSFNNYIKNLNLLEENKYKYTSDSTSLTNNVQTLFSNAGQLGNTNFDTLDIFQSFFNYNPFSSVPQTTVPNEQREQNRIISNQLINAMGWAYYALFAANTSFETEEDIQTQQQILNNQFIYIVNNNTYIDINNISSIILDGNTLSILETIRYNVHQSLRNQIANSRKVIEINIKSESLLPLVYQYYNDLSLYDTIYDLNNLKDATNLSGNLKILSNEN